jgi:hypothetical protein
MKRCNEKGKDEIVQASAGTLNKNITTSHTLYDFVTENCSCGTCYTMLARNDRVPWRKTKGSPTFTNAKHGTWTVQNCPVNNYEGIGYIYISATQVEADRKFSRSIAKETLAKQQDTTAIN